MPKVRQTDNQIKDNVVRGYLAKGQAIQGLSDSEVAVKIHTTRQTYQNKKRRPSTFTLCELRSLKSCLKLTDEEIAQFL